MMGETQPIGELLRTWRQRRRLSQLDLSVEAEISTRHLSFLETGRARPSRDMVLRLAERLDVPLRERNVLLVAAGFAPSFRDSSLKAPGADPAHRAVDLILKGHEPYPALAVDRHWTLVAANGAVQRLMVVEEPALLAPPINVLRVTLHPGGLAPRIANLAEWRAHVLERLRRQVESSADAVLAALLDELRAYPAPHRSAGSPPPRLDLNDIVVPFRLSTSGGVLSFFSTTTVFGTPLDVTLSEIALETFYPADEATLAALRDPQM